MYMHSIITLTLLSYTINNILTGIAQGQRDN